MCSVNVLFVLTLLEYLTGSIQTGHHHHHHSNTQCNQSITDGKHSISNALNKNCCLSGKIYLSELTNKPLLAYTHYKHMYHATYYSSNPPSVRLHQLQRPHTSTPEEESRRLWRCGIVAFVFLTFHCYQGNLQTGS